MMRFLITLFNLFEKSLESLVSGYCFFDVTSYHDFFDILGGVNFSVNIFDRVRDCDMSFVNLNTCRSICSVVFSVMSVSYIGHKCFEFSPIIIFPFFVCVDVLYVCVYVGSHLKMI